MDPTESPGVRNPYEVLGVSPDASGEEIRDAYWRLVRFHRTEGEPAWAASHLEEIQQAYELLSDPTRRAALDASNGDLATVPSREPLQPAPVPAAEPAPQRRSRNPIDRLTYRLPRPWRIAIDWIVTIAGAIAIVLAIKAWVVNPYRIPSSSMEPTLHCAGGPGCEARLSDRVLANRFIYHFRSPHRGEIVVFKTPPQAKARCGAGGTFVKRLIGLPGDRWAERNGYVYINGKKLNESYIKPDRRDTETHDQITIPKGMYFMMGDNRASSCDSRVWGPVPRKNLIGEVFAT
ncbi:MAG TPA: signal peptidase I, partial [Gaiellaceae bacterium]|nr:signal peptidase I [Gaiellaceae bacterium]